MTGAKASGDMLQTVRNWLLAFAAGAAVVGYLLSSRKQTHENITRDAAEARNDVNRLDDDDAIRRELRERGWYRGD